MIEETQEQQQQESIALPENGAEPDYTGLEEYFVPAPHPNSPLNRALQEMEQMPAETGKLSVEESLKRLRQLPQPPDVDWDSTEVIRRMRDAR